MHRPLKGGSARPHGLFALGATAPRWRGGSEAETPLGPDPQQSLARALEPTGTRSRIPWRPPGGSARPHPTHVRTPSLEPVIEHPSLEAPEPARTLPPSRAPAERMSLCPYCGEEQRAAAPAACHACRGVFEPLSRQATQNAMGPWQFRDAANPFRPGCSYETLRALAERGKIDPSTPVRGPTTRQFWMRADETHGLAHLFGRCHACRERARPSDALCFTCGAPFVAPTDRQRLGLGPVRPIGGPMAPAWPARSEPTDLAPPRGAAPSVIRPQIAWAFEHARPIGAPAPHSVDAFDALLALTPTPIAAQRAPRSIASRQAVRWAAVGVGAVALVAVLVIGAVKARATPDSDRPGAKASETAPLSTRVTEAFKKAKGVGGAGGRSRGAGGAGQGTVAEAVRSLRAVASDPEASPTLILRVEAEVARLESLPR